MDVIKSFLTEAEAIAFCDWLETNYPSAGAIIDRNIFTGRFDVLKAY